MVGGPVPTHASSEPIAAQPPGAGASGPRRARGPAPSAACSGTVAFRVLRPRAGWLGQRIQMGPQRLPAVPLRGPRQELHELKEAPRCPPSGSRGPGGGALSGPPGPASRGACVSRPSPPARLRPASPHRGLCPPAARRPLPVPAGSSPPPPRWPHFLGAGGGSGTGTKGLSRGSSQRGGIRSRAERGAKAVLAKKMSA